MGFRPFFLGATLFAIITMAQWGGIYTSHLSIELVNMSTLQWHAHEMIYGYSMAVIAGFFLTAAKNWTGVQTAQGPSLVILFSLWALARILLIFGTAYWPLAAFSDSLFSLYLVICVAIPVIGNQQWKRMALVSKLILLAVGNGLFYLGLGGVIEQGIDWSVYGGLFLILALIVTLSRNLVPFFIERAFDGNVVIKNYLLLDIASLALFIALFVLEVFVKDVFMASVIAAVLFIVYSIRMILWYVKGIWGKAPLWSLYVALLFINFGFLLMATRLVFSISPFLIVHTFSVGGIGLITLAMMSRVSLGHTGRDVKSPPLATSVMFGIFVAGGVTRVALPMLFPDYYFYWVVISQILWVVAFSLFVLTYTRILSSPRIDGRPG